ncbi:MAG: M20/M25/M40 family metallo-hydrolase [Acidimicrobiia bacterium]
MRRCSPSTCATDEATLAAAEQELHARALAIAEAEGVLISTRLLARFEPVAFAPRSSTWWNAPLGHAVAARCDPSGAATTRDAGPRCPSGMIFVPSRDGISHNPAEHTDDAQLLAGAEVLLEVVLALAEEGIES